jgi:hypothetical protein
MKTLMEKLLTTNLPEEFNKNPLTQVCMRMSEPDQKSLQKRLKGLKLQNGEVGEFMVDFQSKLNYLTDEQIAEALNKNIVQESSNRLSGLCSGPIITADNVTLWVGTPASFRCAMSGTAAEWAALTVFMHFLPPAEGYHIWYNKRVPIKGRSRQVDFVIETPAGTYYSELKSRAGAQYRIDMDRHKGSPFFFISRGEDYNQHMIDEMRESNCQPVYLRKREYKRFIPPPINAVSIEDLILAFKGDKPEVVKDRSRTA